MRAFLFPGQGSQAVGMGASLADASRAARDVFDEVDEALGQNLSRLMRDGPEDELKLTENAQPAIMANSVAVLRAWGIQLPDFASFVAGHSLGEYSALCAAGSFDLATTAKLLKLRGQAMQQAVPVGQGAMAALLGADLTLAQKIADAAAQGEVCTVANDNDPTQVVISGHKGAIDRAIELAKDMDETPERLIDERDVRFTQEMMDVLGSALNDPVRIELEIVAAELDAVRHA